MNTPDQNKKDQQEKEFPGYPVYPASDDITNQADPVQADDYGSVNTKVDQNSSTGEGAEQRATAVPKARNAGEGTGESDVTPEDIAMLSAADQNRDMDDPDIEEPMLDTTDEDGDPLNEPEPTYGQAGADLDVPGSEGDDGNENIGEEDEENNYYSLGGDDKSSIEEGDNTSI